MIPSSDIGVFTVMTGDDPGIFFRINLHLYVHDLLLGNEPWLNTSTVCSFPEPWTTKPRGRSGRPRTNIGAQRPLSEYGGVYENKGYGKLDVYVNVTSRRLNCRFGVGNFVLYPKSTKDEFFAQSYGLMENVRDFSTLRFKFKDGKIMGLEIPSFESKDPPLFDFVERLVKKRNVVNGTEMSSSTSSLEDKILFLFAVCISCFVSADN